MTGAVLRILLIGTGASGMARLTRAIASLPQLALCGHARDLSAAYMLAETQEPQVALVDPALCHLPDFAGLVALFQVLGTSWAVLEDGAPTGPSPPPQAAHIRSDSDGPALLAALAALRPAPGALPAPRAPLRPPQAPVSRPAGSGARFRPGRIILLGASTGGIDALLAILSAFPADVPPTLVVQHTGAAHADSLIRLFARCCPARVVAAAPGLALAPGLVVIGAGCKGHLQLRSTGIRRTALLPGPAVAGHMPAVDMLFRSALPIARDVAAAVLTGMGRDGAEGLLALRRAGARTFAQDAASAVAPGMPRAAADLGAAERILPLDQIAAALLAACQHPGPAAENARISPDKGLIS